MQEIIITIGLYIVFISEGFHDIVLEKLHNSKDERKYVTQWHRKDFIFHVLYALVFSYALYDFTLLGGLFLIKIAFARMLFLNSTLNLLKGRYIYYLGNTSKIDKALKSSELLIFICLVIINAGFLIWF